MRLRLHATDATTGARARAWLGEAQDDPANADAPLLVIDGAFRPAFASAAATRVALAKTLGADTLLIGARRIETSPGRSRHDDAWRRHLSDWGGCGDAATAAGAPCPAPAAALLGAGAAREFIARRDAGESVGEALRALIAQRRHWHHPALDGVAVGGTRVLQVVAGLQLGGAERLVVALTTGLRHFGLETELAVTGRTVRTPCPEPAGTRHFAAHGDRDEQCRAIAAYARAGAFDLIHAHLLTKAEIDRLAASGIPILTTVHNTREGWPEGVAESPATAVACTAVVAAQLAETPAAARLVLAENPALAHGRPPADRARARAALGVPDEATLLVCIANFRPQKRLERLPDIAAALATRRRRAGDTRPVWLLVAGEAASPACVPLIESFDRAATQRRDLATIRRLGLIHDTGDLLAAADAYVSPSEHEGSSLALLDALAAGLPVVATAVGAAPDLAKRGCAVTTVPPEATAAIFAEALEPALRTRGGALPDDFTPEAWLRRHCFLYTRELVRAAAVQATSRDGVIFVANNLAAGGAQSGARRLTLELRRRGIPVDMFLLLESPEHPTPGTLALREQGVTVTTLEPAVAGVDAVAALAPLFQKIASRPPRAVLLWNAIPESKVAIAEALAGVIPVVDASPGEMYHASLQRYFSRPRAGGVIRTAPAYAATLAALVVKYAGEGERVTRELGVEPAVILNGVTIPERTERQRAPQAPVVIGTLARLSPQKKLEELLEAFRLVRAEGAHAVLRIAGAPEHDGDAYADALRRRHADLPVDWVGHREDGDAFLRELDIFALVAEPEGCPNASLEAMAAGLPVVATRAGAIPEQIEQDVTGIITERADPRGLADALHRLIQDAALRRRLGDAARECAARRFTVQRMADDYLRVIANAERRCQTGA